MVACGGGNDEPDNPDNSQSNWASNPYYNQLLNTSWRLVSATEYNNDGSVRRDYCQGPLYREYGDMVMTFREEGILEYSCFQGFGRYFFHENGNFQIATPYHFGNIDNISPDMAGSWSVLFGSVGEITTLTSSDLYFVSTYDSSYDVYHYGRTSYMEGGSSGGSSSGGSGSSYEKPEIGLEDYTCYSSSITVKYRIYNQSDANVTSAKGYYGTSSASKSVSATVAGSLITIRLTGLQKNTTYYIKCSATGKGGTTTSETTRLSTTN